MNTQTCRRRPSFKTYRARAAKHSRHVRSRTVPLDDQRPGDYLRCSRHPSVDIVWRVSRPAILILAIVAETVCCPYPCLLRTAVVHMLQILRMQSRSTRKVAQGGGTSARGSETGQDTYTMFRCLPYIACTSEQSYAITWREYGEIDVSQVYALCSHPM